MLLMDDAIGSALTRAAYCEHLSVLRSTSTPVSIYIQCTLDDRMYRPILPGVAIVGVSCITILLKKKQKGSEDDIPRSYVD